MANLTPRTMGLLGLGAGMLTARPNYGAFSPGQGMTQGLNQYQGARNFELMVKRNQDMQKYREAMAKAATSGAALDTEKWEEEKRRYEQFEKFMEEWRNRNKPSAGGIPNVSGMTPQGAVVQTIPSANAKLYAKDVEQLWKEELGNVDRQYLGDNAQMDSQMYSPGVNYGEGPQVGMAGTIAQLPIDPGRTAGMQTQQTPAPVTPQYQQRPPQMPSFALDPFQQQVAATPPPQPMTAIGTAQQNLARDQARATMEFGTNLSMLGGPKTAGPALQRQAQFDAAQEQQDLENRRKRYTVDDDGVRKDSLTEEQAMLVDGEWIPFKNSKDIIEHRKALKEAAAMKLTLKTFDEDQDMYKAYQSETSPLRDTVTNAEIVERFISEGEAGNQLAWKSAYTNYQSLNESFQRSNTATFQEIRRIENSGDLLERVTGSVTQFVAGRPSKEQIEDMKRATGMLKQLAVQKLGETNTRFLDYTKDWPKRRREFVVPPSNRLQPQQVEQFEGKSMEEIVRSLVGE